MTEAEKHKHQEAFVFIRERIGGCFGSDDGIFAAHFADEESARKLRALAKRNGVQAQEVISIAHRYLLGKGFQANHIAEQMQKITVFFSK